LPFIIDKIKSTGKNVFYSTVKSYIQYLILHEVKVPNNSFFTIVMVDLIKSTGINVYYSTINYIIWHEDKVVKVIMFIIGFLVHFRFNMDIAYCMDALPNKITSLEQDLEKSKARIVSLKQKVKLANLDFKVAIIEKDRVKNSDMMSLWKADYDKAKASLKTHNTDLENTRKAQKAIIKKLETMLSSKSYPSILGKRKDREE